MGGKGGVGGGVRTPPEGKKTSARAGNTIPPAGQYKNSPGRAPHTHTHTHTRTHLVGAEACGGEGAAGEGVRHVRGRRLGGEGVLPHRHAPAVPHREQAALADVERGGGGGGVVGMEGAEGAHVPDLDLAVGARGDEVVARGVDGGGAQRAVVAEHADDGGVDVGGPHGEGAVAVAEREDGVPRVLGEDVAGAEAGAVLRDDLPRGRVLVAQHARLADRGEQEVVRQKGEPPRLGVLLVGWVGGGEQEAEMAKR